ncbi:MAG: hypothetical protein Q9218_008105 [Villophora microphyllina]
MDEARRLTEPPIDDLERPLKRLTLKSIQDNRRSDAQLNQLLHSLPKDIFDKILLYVFGWIPLPPNPYITQTVQKAWCANTTYLVRYGSPDLTTAFLYSDHGFTSNIRKLKLRYSFRDLPNWPDRLINPWPLFPGRNPKVNPDQDLFWYWFPK